MFNLFNFHYFVTSFVFYQKTECKSIYYNFRRDRESSRFRKLARNKWICGETCDFFRDQYTLLAINSGKSVSTLVTIAAVIIAGMFIKE